MSVGLVETVRERTADLPGDLRQEIARATAEILDAGVSSVDGLRTFLHNREIPSNQRAIACYVAGRLGDSEFEPLLTEAFSSSSDPGVIWEAAKALVLIRNAATVPKLRSALLEDCDVTRRTAAAWALGAFGEHEAVPDLQRVLGDREADEQIRAHTAEALGALKAREATDDLLNALHDNSAEIRYWAAYALGALRELRAVEALDELARTDTATVTSGASVADEARWAVEQIRAARTKSSPN